MSYIDDKTYEKDGRLIVPWTDPNGRILHLLTLEEYAELPMGTVLGSISGDTCVKTQQSILSGDPNYIDLDTRMGRMAFGLIAPIEGRAITELFIKFIAGQAELEPTFNIEIDHRAVPSLPKP